MAALYPSPSRAPQHRRPKEVPIPDILRDISRRLRDVALYSTTDRFELSVGFLALIWGLILLNPFAKTFDSTPAFSAMASIAPEEIWGCGAVFSGFLSIFAIGIDHRRMRRLAAGLHGVAWLFIASMLGIGNPLGTGWAVYGMFSFLSFLAFLRLAPRKTLY